ncbi:MAG TPA: SpoIID/LytB domain-containing protein [Nocardioides sp.]|uniref:SpoIID/LytB domain-containing protein n=1 Tax=Nocardioides sp. TaxID=35761 RepID=UPI002CE4DC04|nr:SpoIID/LytB domain-containing protein [Nocardioides sp.]HTW18523.1 SpoIID/LytB domain-containing protein [Nocardioides sp.]
MRLRLLLVPALAGLLLAPPPAQAADRWAVPAGSTVTISGHGYGHGHGMSQYGAQGAARQGLSHDQILAFYYAGTTPGKIAGRVSVQISADTTDDLLVRARAGLTVTDRKTGRRWTLPRNGARLWRVATNRKGVTRVTYRTDRWHRWRVLRGDGEIAAGGRPVTLVTPSGDRPYRGRLRHASVAGGGHDTVNVLSLEAYLRGVVPLEMPATWSPAAVRAQAVAARTYAAYERAHPRSRHAQLCDTTSCQVYGGYAAEHPASNAAIAATRGSVLLDGGRPAFTQFSSSSGGWTSAGSVPYLRAFEDVYDGWSGNPVHAWTVRLAPARLERAWPRIGTLRDIRVTARDGNGKWGGRVRSVTLTGSAGSVTVSGDTFRSVLGLRSTYLTFAVS